MPNILLVEDDKIIAESIIFSLENDSFTVKWCEMGSDALKLANEIDFGLVLLDIGLPDISGFDVLRKIRKSSEVPVIIITARDADEDIVLGLEGLGADDYVTKPFNPRVLIARIRTQLRHADIQPEAPKKSLKPSSEKTFEINKDLHQISLLKQVLELTKAECKILSYLINNPNQIHSKEQLLNIMHDKPSGSSEDTIITHIRSIRRAIKKADIDNEYIKNHRGLGYSLTL
ncbi:response regulator [Candidatus Thioglobus autotrophicus]|uniref:response regulator n=1 Tax=Candidatus Thioglobus autotrophicus TaxID=1705394 RepID=UPI00299D80E7|nr:response regulator [Candidatus Thioglobus autotrophicus]WPE18703.1 response regulator [Candidatus Thioglobus autotrophicus]